MMIFAFAMVGLGLFAIRRSHRLAACGGPGMWHHERHGHGHHHHGRHGGWRHRKLRWALRRLETTPAQERALRQEWKDLRQTAAAARADVAAARGDLGAVLTAPVLDRDALGAVVARVDRAYGEVRIAATEALARVHAQLDDHQRAQIGRLLGATSAPTPTPAPPAEGPFR